MGIGDNPTWARGEEKWWPGLNVSVIARDFDEEEGSTFSQIGIGSFGDTGAETGSAVSVSDESFFLRQTTSYTSEGPSISASISITPAVWLPVD